MFYGSTAVYHHLYKNRADNDTVFRMVDEHIQEFAQIPFDSKLVLVATWYKVPPYGSTQQVTTFLCVIWLACAFVCPSGIAKECITSCVFAV